ncbi:exosome complex component RRP4 [Nematocida minor]|uniref:exosome complex component RRP4 n=1 Tax=Nematocida minor TaxID=1912983 RepID=UPI00221EBFC8|nr:exosome complex component RRP4 [Nematocida minor]KAI5192544.1 exosome complex component RRP4 [Nematocida minor]
MSKVVWPGERLEYTDDCLEGHGIHKEKQENAEDMFVASVCGRVTQVDRLITVETETYWYNPCIGDVVVGKVTGIANKRWYIEINTRQESVLLLNSINLIGNVQRRKGELDEIMMSEYYAIGDIVIAEVQSVGNKVQLHTRNPKYRKISFGVLLKTDKVLKDRKQYHHETMNGKEVEIVAGKNGCIVIHSDDTAAHREIKEIASRVFEYI